MNIVYLVGNGFDLNIGLKTAPEDFLSQFISENINKEEVPSRNLAETIEKEGVKTWSDFEIKLGEYSKNFNTDNYGEYLSAVDELLFTLRSKLLEENQSVSNELIQKNVKGTIASLKNFREKLEPEERAEIERIKGAHPDQNWNYSIISFNYTSVLSRLFYEYAKSNNSFGKVDNRRVHSLDSFCYAHGNLDGVIVSGVDNPDQITNSTLREIDDVLANIVKEKIQRELSTDFDSIAKRLISNASIICIYGMAMGSSDKRWWKIIADRLKANSNTALIIYSYEFSKKNPHTPYSRYQIIQQEKEKFYTGAELSIDDQTIISERIFILKSQDVFPWKN